MRVCLCVYFFKCRDDDGDDWYIKGTLQTQTQAHTHREIYNRIFSWTDRCQSIEDRNIQFHHLSLKKKFTMLIITKSIINILIYKMPPFHIYFIWIYDVCGWMVVCEKKKILYTFMIYSFNSREKKKMKIFLVKKK